jgi:hypothetical protein
MFLTAFSHFGVRSLNDIWQQYYLLPELGLLRHTQAVLGIIKLQPDCSVDKCREEMGGPAHMLQLGVFARVLSVCERRKLSRLAILVRIRTYILDVISLDLTLIEGFHGFPKPRHYLPISYS